MATTEELTRPKLFKIHEKLNAIFLYIADNSPNSIEEIHSTVMRSEYAKYWQTQRIVIMFDMASSLTSGHLVQLTDILDLLKANIITIYIRMHFDLIMNHIDMTEVCPFFNKIFICAQSYSLHFLRITIKYRHCDVDYKWHSLSHQLVTKYIKLPFNNNPKRLSMRAMDFIIFWKLNSNEYKQFLNNLRLSISLSLLQIEWSSLYKHTYIISDIFNAIAHNISISGLTLTDCPNDSDDNNGITQDDEDLTSLLSKDNDADNKGDDSHFECISNCFQTKKIDAKYGGNGCIWKRDSIYNLGASRKDFKLTVHSKYQIKQILNALHQNEHLCLNWLSMVNGLPFFAGRQTLGRLQ